LYWFSQSVGPGRGIEDVIEAAALLDTPVELALRGRIAPAYAASLEARARSRASRLSVRFLALVPPDETVDACRPYDVGISAEQQNPPNRPLTLTNKATTYILAGLPVALTAIPGHEALARDLGDGAIVFRPGDAAALAAGLDRLLRVPGAMARARDAAWRAAARRWHWEHEDERGALLRLVEEAAA
jgi:glycosyltransferase involved in cell wall biosynthesis